MCRCGECFGCAAPALSREQVDEAIAQMISRCRALEAEYTMASARGVLYELGYEETEAEYVLDDIAARGFWYCLDSQIPHQDGERPTQSVCIWGPDQLRSRLECLHTPTERRGEDA